MPETPVETDVEEPTIGEIAANLGEDSVNAVKEKIQIHYGPADNTPMYYPSNLKDQIAKGREYMRIKLVSRDMLAKQSIYLLTPPGLSVPDGATWNNIDLGTLLGAGTAVAKRGADAIKNLAQGKSAGKVVGVEDLVAAAAFEGIDTFTPVIGAKALMSAGISANPYTNTQFSGTNIRTFDFAFKMISENASEALTASQIENFFRKFLYPRKHPESDMVLVYPPLWEIDFYKDVPKKEGEGTVSRRNPFMPRLHLCNMLSLNVVYNATGNSYHTDGSPTEMDINISFSETQSLTRDDLYGDEGDHPFYGGDNSNYDDKAFWPNRKSDQVNQQAGRTAIADKIALDGGS